MKIQLFLYVIIISLSSCATAHYYYPTLDSSDLKKNSKGQFVSESDSLGVTYSFSGENAPLKVTLNNKMQSTLYVDWSNSWLIINGSKPVHFTNNVNRLPELAKVKANTQYEQTLFPVCAVDLSEVTNDKTLYSEKKIHKTISKHKRVALDSLSFTEDNAPVYIASHLTLRIENLDTPVELDEHFFVSGIKLGKINPKHYTPYIEQRGDEFYIKDAILTPQQVDRDRQVVDLMITIFSSIVDALTM